MNTFKKKALFAAVSGLGVMGMVGSAQAVSLNPDGLGQVLIYPYYTVRASADGEAFNSLISIVNSQGVGKAVKVRFLEGKFSQEVLDFNLYLSEWDVWTGALVPTADGTRLMTRDTSCTNPPIPAAGVDFRHFQYTQRNPDLEDQTLDRTREGYVEVIEMADFIRPWVDSQGVSHRMSPTERDITHTNVGGDWRPLDCRSINNTNMAANLNHLVPGEGGLFGSMTLINPNEAQGIAYEAVALDAWNASNAIKWYPSGSINPHLGEVMPKTSTVISGPEVFITEDWGRGIDAVSAVLMNEAVYNEFMLEPDVAGKTDWVVTFPTKQYYYSNTSGRNQIVQALFENNFIVGGACDTIAIEYTDREERKPLTYDDFSPMPIGGKNALCWESNIITFGNGATPILNSKNSVNLGVSDYETGWARLSFSPDQVDVTNAAGAVVGTRYIHQLIGDNTGTAHQVAGGPLVFTSGETLYIDLSAPVVAPVTFDTVTFTGLPMVGFAVQQFNNGEAMSPSLGKVWASYATRINHRFSKNITVQ